MKFKKPEPKKKEIKRKDTVRPVELNQRLVDLSRNNKPLHKKNGTESNTDFNNKRFDKDKYKINNIIKEETTGNSNFTNSAGKNKSKKSNTRYKIDEHLKDLEKEIFNADEEEDEEVKCVPKPIDAFGSNLNKNVKVNDFRLMKGVGNSCKQQQGNHLYMPDFMAKKIVEDIIQKKMNEEN